MPTCGGGSLAHDGRVFAMLFDRHANKVYNHCFGRSADWSMAEDLTSVVFLEAWRKRRQVPLHGDAILPWLLAVAMTPYEHRWGGVGNP